MHNTEVSAISFAALCASDFVLAPASSGSLPSSGSGSSAAVHRQPGQDDAPRVGLDGGQRGRRRPPANGWLCAMPGAGVSAVCSGTRTKTELESPSDRQSPTLGPWRKCRKQAKFADPVRKQVPKQAVFIRSASRRRPKKAMFSYCFRTMAQHRRMLTGASTKSGPNERNWPMASGKCPKTGGLC